MKPTETISTLGSYIGHVKDGVIVPDSRPPLHEGQAVRIEPLAPGSGTPVDSQQAEQLKKMQDLFAQWDKEDKEVTDDNAEAFHQALEHNRGLNLRTPKLL